MSSQQRPIATHEAALVSEGKQVPGGLAGPQRPRRSWTTSLFRAFAALAAAPFAVLLAASLALAAVAPPSHAARGTAAASGEMTIYVSDQGIRQMERLRPDAKEGPAWTMSGLPDEARILLAMPKQLNADPASVQALRRVFFDDLKRKVDKARSRGHSQIEIQLIQDVSGIGYFAWWRQDGADRFGAAAYGAIADLNRHLAKQGVRTTNRAHLGSNGAKVFAVNVDAWSPGGKSLWASVDVFDGRAYFEPMAKAIDRIGVERVRLFNTRWDLWAPNDGGRFRSVGNTMTSRQLKDERFPRLRVYRLEAVEGKGGHISGMSDARRFRMYQYLGKDKGELALPRDVAGSELRQPAQLPVPVQRIVPPNSRGVAVWPETARDLAASITQLGDQLTIPREGSQVRGAPMAAPQHAKSLVDALSEDIARAEGQPVVILKSRTLEELVKLVLEVASQSPLADKGVAQQFAKDVEALKATVTGISEGMRAGKLDADSMKNYDKVVVEVLKRQLGDRHEAALMRRYEVAAKQRAVEKIEDDLRRRVGAARHGQALPNLARHPSAKVRDLSRQLAEHRTALTLAHAQVKAAQQRYTAVLLLLDTLPELAAAVTEHAHQGRLTLAVVDRYSDAVITLSASYLAAVLSKVPVLAPAAPEIRDAIVATSRYTRDELARKPIERVYGLLSDHKWKVLEQYNDYMRHAVNAEGPVRKLSEVHKLEDLHQLGFTTDQIARFDAVAERFNGSRPPPPRQSDPPGGLRPPLDPFKPRLPDSGAGRPQVPELPPAPPTAPPPPPPGPGPGGAPRVEPPPAGPVESPRPSTPCAPGAGHCGGIDLNLVGLVIDPATRRLVVVNGGGAPPVDGVSASVLALGLWLEYTGKTAAFSLDPYDRKDPNGKWLRAVYYPEALGGTPAGNACFHGDFDMKQMSFGVRIVDGRIVERRSPSGLKGVPQLGDGRAASNDARWHRMWIVNRSVVVSAGQGVLTVESIRMGAEVRRQVVDRTAKTGLRDVKGRADGPQERFARQFEAKYDELAAGESPSLAEIREIVKAIALARALKQSGARVDLPEVVRVIENSRVPAVDRVQALSVTWRGPERQEAFDDGQRRGVRTTARQLRMFGGVNLEPRLSVAAGRDGELLRDAVLEHLRDAGRSKHAEFTHAGRRYHAQVLPFGVLGAQGR